MQVAMVSFITASTDPTYGVINGYAIATNGAVPVSAALISVPSGSALQFVNGETPSTPSINHSAVGFPGVSAFPPVPFTFPSADAQAVGSQISGSNAWSTGIIAPNCYSQTFIVGGAGPYFFGDDTYYNESNTRDVIVISQ
ncbi:MAG: hypothetical protein ACLPYS_15920 [Vulcanimicrobiaceae bacterium]